MDAVSEHLTPDERDAVLTLVAAVTDADGVGPLNDEARLLLTRPGATHRLAWHPGPLVEPTPPSGVTLGSGGTPPADGTRLAGYAQLDHGFGTAQLCVHPGFRRRGLGARLLTAVLDDGASGVWAFGDLQGAQALARTAHLDAERRLLIMERPLSRDDVATRAAPPGITLAAFADADTDGFLRVNAAAFAHHPEQGAFALDDLRARQAEPWWDPAGLIVARDDQGVVGFHWTKRHDAQTGEVYVIGVDPRAQGLGLGSVLLDAGLAHLAAAGCSRVILYVEADNPAVRLYERSGFHVGHTDALYTRARG